MLAVMSEQMRQERQSLRLVSCCEDCEHFVDDELAAAGAAQLVEIAALVSIGPNDDRARCDLLYPTTPHRRATWDATADGEGISFCKMFEAK